MADAVVPATPSVGVLVMAYGTPSGPDDVAAYYTHIRRGRPPAPEQLADLRRRYDAIGGTSPLRRRTEAQLAALQRALDASDQGRYRTFLGMKHSAPFIEDAAAEMHGAGLLDGSIALVLAPHYSRLSTGEYIERLERAATELAGEAGVGLGWIESWHLEAGLVSLLADRVREATAALAEREVRRATVLFTAHSLPARVLDEGDPYPDQVRETAAAVAAEAGVGDWRVAWQSAGRTPEPWLGPDLLEVIRSLPDDGGVDGVVVCPVGFTSDHLEVLYDVDIEARAVAEAAGLALVRTRSLNDDPRFVDVLAGLVRAAAALR